MTKLARYAAVIRASRPRPLRWQVHITSSDGSHSQVAQREFPSGTPGYVVLAWASAMVDASSIAKPVEWNIWRDDDESFLYVGAEPVHFTPTSFVAIGTPRARLVAAPPGGADGLE